MPIFSAMSKLARPGEAVRVAGILLFSGVSAVATFDGLSSISQNLAFAVAMTVAVQLAILWTAFLFFNMHGFTRRSIAAAVYGLAVLLSVGYGYGFWYDRLSGAAHRQADFRAAYEELVEPLAARAIAFRDFARQATEIATYSQERHAEEVRDGGTCGVSSPPGPGPLARRRAADSDLFSAMVPELQRLAGEMEALVVKARESARAQEELTMGQIRAEALALDRNSVLERWRRAAAERLEIGRSGWIENGLEHRCPDATLEQRLEAALAVSLPELPDRNRDVFGVDRADALRHAFAILSGGLLGKASFNADLDGVPLATGVVTDLMILLLAWFGRQSVDPAPRRPSGRRRRGVEALVDALQGEPQLKKEQLDTMVRALGSEPNALLAALERYMIRDKGCDYLLVPDPAAAHWPIARLARVLTALDLADDRGLALARNLPERWLAMHDAEVVETGKWTPYRLRAGVYEELLLDLIRSEPQGHGADQAESPRKRLTAVS